MSGREQFAEQAQEHELKKPTTLEEESEAHYDRDAAQERSRGAMHAAYPDIAGPAHARRDGDERAGDGEHGGFDPKGLVGDVNEQRADADGGGARGGDRQGNAYMRVVGQTTEGETVKWTGRTSYDGSMPYGVAGRRQGGRWSWTDSVKELRLNTAAAGSTNSGVSVEEWAADNDVIRVSVSITARTFDVIDDESTDLGERIGGGVVELVEEEDPNNLPDTTEREFSQNLGGGAIGPEADGAGRDTGKSGNDTNSDAEVDSDESDIESELTPAEEAADRLATQIEDELGIGDAEDGMEEGSVDGVEGGTDVVYREGSVEDGSVYTEGYSEGDEIHEDAEQGKKSKHDTGVLHGGTEEGVETGGEGGAGSNGARHAVGLFGGLLNVPAAIRGVVELALIAEEGNIFGQGLGAFKGLAQKITKRGVKTEMRLVRAELASDARRAAAQGFKRGRRKMMKDKAWKTMSVAERKEAERVVYWELQRTYFEGVEAAAEEQIKRLAKKLKKAKKLKGAKGTARREAIEAELQTATAARDVAHVQPVAGRLPRNHAFAGKEFPRDLLPAAYREKGLQFTAAGYPDFAPYAKELPNGERWVSIELTASRRADEKAANGALGWKKTPAGWTWHHSEDELGKMILVPTDLHDAVGHTGGAATFTHVTGIPYGN